MYGYNIIVNEPLAGVENKLYKRYFLFNYINLIYFKADKHTT